MLQICVSVLQISDLTSSKPIRLLVSPAPLTLGFSPPTKRGTVCSLPPAIRNSDSINVFKSRLETLVFLILSLVCSLWLLCYLPQYPCDCPMFHAFFIYILLSCPPLHSSTPCLWPLIGWIVCTCCLLTRHMSFLVFCFVGQYYMYVSAYSPEPVDAVLWLTFILYLGCVHPRQNVAKPLL